MRHVTLCSAKAYRALESETAPLLSQGASK